MTSLKGHVGLTLKLKVNNFILCFTDRKTESYTPADFKLKTAGRVDVLLYNIGGTTWRVKEIHTSNT